MPRITGEYVNRVWNIGAKQVRQHRDGHFYMPLERFPGALADYPHGYVLFRTEDEYENCPQLLHPEPGDHPRLNVKKPPGHISGIPGYVKVE